MCAHMRVSWKARLALLPNPFLGTLSLLCPRKEDVMNEINIMNQLSHANLIQLYDAFQGKSSFTLVLE